MTVCCDKLLLLSNHLKRRLALPTLNASEQFVTACARSGLFQDLILLWWPGGGSWPGENGWHCAFPVTVVFPIITSGGKPSNIVLRTCLVYGGTLTPPFVLLEPQRSMSPLHEDWLLVSLNEVIYFALLTKKGTLLIGPSLVLLLNID